MGTALSVDTLFGKLDEANQCLVNTGVDTNIFDTLRHALEDAHRASGKGSTLTIIFVSEKLSSDDVLALWKRMGLAT